MMYPVIGAYRLDDKVRIEVDGVLREGKIICIGLNGYVVAADACVFVVNDPQIKWCLRTSGEKEPTDEIKCGNRVQTPLGALMVDMIAGANIFGHYENGDAGIWTKEELSKLNSADHNDNTLTIPVKVDIDDTYWDAYKAELASKIAVAYAEKGRFAPDEIGGFAVRVANDVVDNLKKQSE